MSSYRRNQLAKTKLKCPICGFIYPLWRYKHRQKRQGHKKDMWCPQCEKLRKFREVKEVV